MGLAALSIFEPIAVSRGGQNQNCECVCGRGGEEELPDFISK